MKANLRVNEPQFTEELLRDSAPNGRTIGCTLQGNQSKIRWGNMLLTIRKAHRSARRLPQHFLNYYYEELKVNKHYNYHTSAYGAEGFRWNWGRGGGGDPTTPNTAVDLADAMSKNPNLKILVFNGYFDLATPFFATEYTFNHMGLQKNIQSNITLKYFQAGHMMYINPSCLPDFKKNIVSFISSTSK